MIREIKINDHDGCVDIRSEVNHSHGGVSNSSLTGAAAAIIVMSRGSDCTLFLVLVLLILAL